MGAIFGVFFIFSVLLLFMRSADTDYLLRLSVKMAGIIVYTGIGIKTGIITLDNLLLIGKAVGGTRFTKVQKESR